MHSLAPLRDGNGGSTGGSRWKLPVVAQMESCCIIWIQTKAVETHGKGSALATKAVEYIR